MKTTSNAFITGASRGIGKAIALRLAGLGYGVFLLGRDEAALAAVTRQCETLGVGAAYLAGDLTDSDYRDRAMARAGSALGSVEVLVNNAGYTERGTVQEADIQAWQAVMEVNFNAALYFCRFLVPAMVEQQRGAVINISSLSGRHTGPKDAIYSATKHAMIGFTGCLYEDVRESGIKVTSILPGFVATDLTAGIGRETKNMIQPDDVADAVAYVLSASSACCPTEIVLRPQLRP